MPPLLRDRHALEQERRDKVKAKLARETDTTVPLLSGGNEGDQLRGIPAIGRGVSGAIRDTSPDRVTLTSDRRRTMAARSEPGSAAGANRPQSDTANPTP